MMRKLQYVCLAGSIGLAGDRIDLFAGRGPFILTPFLILAPLFVLITFLRMQVVGLFTFKLSPRLRQQIPFVLGISLFIFFAMVSVVFSLDPARSIVAFADLFLVAVLGFLISRQILEEPQQEKLLRRSITFGIAAYSFFCVAEAIAWSRGMVNMGDGTAGSWIELTFAPNAFAYGLPRLCGTAIDPNRAGFELVMYLVLLDRFVAKSRFTFFLRCLIAVLLLLTLSKSAIICWLAYYFFSKTFWIRLLSPRALVWIAVGGIILSLAALRFRNKVENLAEAYELSSALTERFSIDQGSSGESHILLIRRGIETWQSSAKTIATGIGFASAPKVLEDFFGDAKQSNFHSLYVTVLAELGLPAFIVLCFLLGYPILGRRGSIPCIAAILAFNLSYQSHMEPLFWIVLALVWSYQSVHISWLPTTLFAKAAAEYGAAKSC